MNVKFITLAASGFKAWDAKYEGFFVHLTEAVTHTDGEEEIVDYPAGLYFGGHAGWEMLTNDTDVAAIKQAIEDAVNALDTTANVVVASEEDGVVTLTKAVKEEDGIISAVDGDDSEISLAKVATTGAAEDIKFAQYPETLEGDEKAKIAADADLQTVMEGVIDAISDANADAVLALYDSKGDVLTDAKAVVKADGTTYTLKQGTGSDAKTIASFNIVKDSFVKSGSVVYGTLSEDEFTPETPEKDGSNAYIKLEFATRTDDSDETVVDPIYIPAASLIEYSSVAEGDLYLTSSEDHVISVTDKVKDAITKVEGLTVNGKEVADDGTVTIDAADIEYKAAADGEDAESVKDTLDDILERLEEQEAIDPVETTVAGDTDAALENTGVNVIVKVAEAEDSDNNHDYTISATAEMVWLNALPA